MVGGWRCGMATSDFSRYLSRPHIEAVLRRALEAPETVEGTVHENHYHKLILRRDEVGHASPIYRGHIWLSAPGRGGTVHTHRWGFSSIVLKGEMTTRTFARSETGISFEHYAYNPDEDPQFSRIGTATLDVVDSCRIRPGECYSLSPETIHQARPIPGTMTLIARANSPSLAFADVFTKIARADLAETVTALSPVEIGRDLE